MLPDVLTRLDFTRLNETARLGLIGVILQTQKIRSVLKWIYVYWGKVDCPEMAR